MLRFGCVFLLFAACALDGAPAVLPWKLPPLEGEFEGEFGAEVLPGAPALRWAVTVNAPRPRERVAGFSVTGAGTAIRGGATLDPRGDGLWRITEAAVDLAGWWPVLTAKFFPAQSGLTVSGTVALTGGGTLRDGGFTAQLAAEVRDGAVADAAKLWSASGVTLQARFASAPAFALTETVRVQFREASIAGVALRDGVVEFALAADGVMRVSRAECGVLGGRVALAPFAVEGAKGEVRTMLEFSALDLGGLGKFLPAALADARGLVSGKMELGWDLGRGLTLAAGSLVPGAAQPAVVRLAPTPGFLTERLPENVRERFNLLPKWLGPLGQMFAPANPAYPLLRGIEMGESSLEVISLEVGLRLDGDARGRTAHVVALTRPTARGTAVESVRFEFNVTGPLADFVRLLAEGRVNLRTR